MCIDFIHPNSTPNHPLPNLGGQNPTGFPSSEDEFMEPIIDLNRTLIKHPIATFYARVKGNSMKDARIDDGDLLMVDKSLPYRNQAIVVCAINGEFTLRTIEFKGNSLWLMAANEDVQPTLVSEDDEFTIWGTVTYVIKKTY